MKYAYFPGCATKSTGVEYGLSLKFLCQSVGVELLEMPDWNCCGATAAHALDEELALALPARSLALLEQQGEGLDVVAPCAACYSRMKHTIHATRHDPQKAARINELIGRPYKGESDVLSLLEVMDNEQARARIAANVLYPLNGLKVACYYGCLFLRPAAITGAKETENPQTMENLLALAGAENVEWAFKTECCGASHQVALPKAARPLVYDILHNAQANGAEAIAAACPLCMMNLDMREKELNRSRGAAFDIPVFYFTELLALALGAAPHAVGLNRHFYPTTKVVERILGKAGVKS